MLFWIIISVLSVAVAAFVLRPVLSRSDRPVDATRFDLQVYRDQLTEVERDLQRGVLSGDDAERTRIEISRRILDADGKKTEDRIKRASRTANGLMLAVTLVMLVGGSGGVYYLIGARGAPDLPLDKRMDRIAKTRENRLSQSKAEAGIGVLPGAELDHPEDYVALVAQLRDTVAARNAEGTPDLQGNRLLAEHEAALGDFVAARKAQGVVVAILGDSATAAEYTDLAELMIIAANGYVSPEAEQALARALRLDPKEPRLRYYSGLNLVQNGRPDIAYNLWSDLLAEGPVDAPWIAPINAQIDQVARMAGIQRRAPAPGPDAGDIAAASDLDAEERNALIASMVTRLSTRLAEEGGTADEWARLIRAYGVLEDTAKASAVWNEARDTFAGDEGALALLLQAAQNAGVAN